MFGVGERCLYLGYPKQKTDLGHLLGEVMWRPTQLPIFLRVPGSYILFCSFFTIIIV